ncbi:MAG TPA: S8 family serine peptidase [Mycobacteriales bacterium]|nr:S8 family serine peptidase [Mycobacteriales bacterium]
MPFSFPRVPLLVAALPLALAGCAAGTVPATTPAATIAPAPTGPTAAAPASPAPAPAPTSVPASASAPVSWDRPQRSASPETVVAAAPVRGSVRVVTVRAVGGRPQVDVQTVDGRSAAARAVERSQRQDGVVSVGLDARAHATAAAKTNDSYRGQQWALDRLKAEDVWTRQTAAGVTVAVVDSGVAANHPDLKGAVLAGTDYVAPGGDGSADANGHGTHVAGIIGATANNRAGIAGLALGVKIIPVRVLDGEGSGWNSDIAKGIVYAADRGAAVINLSLGSSSAGTTVRDAVAYAHGKGSVVVAAAGNSRASGSPTSYPAAFANVIGVGATDSVDHVASFSNAGSYVDVAAPGVKILSTYPADAYANLNGTSMATPYVAAAAALLRAAKPSSTPAEVAAALQKTAVDLGAAGRDNDFGYGLIDPQAALCSVVSCATATPAPSSASPSPTSAPSPSASPSPSTSPSPTTSPSPAAPALAGTVTRMLSKPAVVRYGARVSGVARVLDARGTTGLSRVPVEICTRVHPATGYTCRTHTTDTNGTIRYAFVAQANTAVFARHRGTARTAASVSATAVGYTVVPGVRVSTGRNTLTASVSSADRPRVRLERWNGKKWLSARSATGTTVTFVRLPAAYYRVQVTATARLGGTTTDYVRVR